MSKFKVGDTVQCMDAGSGRFLTVGAKYVVNGSRTADHVVVTDDTGDSGAQFGDGRFVLVSYKVGDKVKVLPFEVHESNTGRAHLESMLPSIGNVLTVNYVYDNGVGLSDGWNYDFKFVSPVNAEVSTESPKPNAEVVMKEVVINVVNQSKKVQRKLSAKLAELGYPLDQDHECSAEFSSTRIYQVFDMNHDLHATSCRPDAIVVDAEGMKFKAVLAEVCSHLGLNTGVLSTEVTLDTPNGTKVRTLVSSDGFYEVGAVGVLQHDGSQSPAVKFSDDYWYANFNELEIVPDTTDITVCNPSTVVVVPPEPVSTEVGAYTPVGTKVRLIVDHDRKVYKGAVGVLVRHDGDEQPRVDFKDNYWYPSYSKLEVVSDDTEVTVCHPETHVEEPKPEVKPQSIKDGNFPVTRVRVKESGAEGVVIGRGVSGTSIAVLHDEPKDSLHNGNGHVKGADKRTWFYPEYKLEVI